MSIPPPGYETPQASPPPPPPPAPQRAPLSHEDAKAQTGSRPADDNVQYEFKSVQALRGRESSATAKWQDQGWEFVSENRGTLRTELNFRRVKPKTIGTYFRKFASQSYAAFRRLDPKTLRRLLAVSGGLVLLMVGVVVVGIQGGGGTPGSTASPTKPTTSPSKQPEAEAYTYQGPQYEIVRVDEDVTNAGLNQYWVYMSKLDYSTDVFKNQVKMIIADIAHNDKTPKLIVQVVTDKEIIEAESNSTIADFTDEHGPNYFKNVIAPKEKTDWVASYSGGFDSDTAQPSESAAAFEIAWLPEKVQGIEKWKPTVAG